FGDGLTGFDTDQGHTVPGWEIIEGVDIVVKEKTDIDFNFDFVSDSTLWEYKTSVSTIEEIPGIQNINLFPNPANDYITLAFELEEKQNLNIRIFNSLGQMVYQGNEIDYSYGGFNEQISVNQLSNGLYFLELSNEKGEKNTLRFTVEK
ncbi:MAG: T9SS type A sorting domain-containing protein, partial [Bacteroidota bacterium]